MGTETSTFLSGGGIVTTDFGGSDFGSSIVLQSDGKIIVAGESSGGGDGGFAAVRYNADGSLDTTFDGDGKVTTDFGGLEYATSAALQSDGKIVVAGYNGISSSGGGDFAVVRYNTNGSLDTTFDGDGRVTTDLGGWDKAESVKIESDGKIVVAGYTGISSSGGGDFAVVRYNSNGSLDTSFGVNGNGKVITNIGAEDYVHSLIVQSDKKIVVIGECGISSSGGSDFALVRYNANGSLDTTFGVGGKVTTDFRFGDFVGGAAIQPDGTIVVVGASYSLADMAVSGGQDFVIVRYNSNGTLDTSFDSDGKIVADFGGSDSAHSVTLQPDGKIVVTGSSSPAGGSGSGEVIVVRYNTNGTLDTTFSGDGVVKTALGDESEGNSVVVRPDGRILVAGASASTGNPDFLLVRYNADGSMAPGIDFDGTPVGTPSSNESFADLFVDASQQNLAGYIGSALVELSPPGVLHCFDEDHDGFADHFTRTWTDATGTQSISGTTTWLDNSVFKSSGSALIGGIPYSINQYGRVAYDAQGDVVGLYFLAANPVFTLTPDTTAGDALIATFTIPNQTGTWSLLDSDLNGVVDKMTRVQTYIENNVPKTDTKEYSFTWSDSTHWTARVTTVDLGFGKIFDNQGRPTTIPFYTHTATGPDVLHEIPLVWQSKGADNVVATASLINALSVKLLDTNADNLPDQAIFTSLSFASSIEGGPLFTTIVNFTGWSNLNSTNTHIAAELQTSTDPSLMFTGTVTGTSSNPTTLAMPSYFMGSSGNVTDTTPPTIASFSPVDGVLGVTVDRDIVLTFSEAIQFGNGTIEIHSGSATGTIVASYDVATSHNLTITGNTLAINPTADLTSATHYFVTFSDGSVKDLTGNSYAGTASYDFTTSDGRIITDFGGSAFGFGMAIQSDGKILMTGASNGDFALARYNQNGSLDTSFSGDGKVTTDIGTYDFGFSVTVLSDGKILLSGISNGDFLLLRYHSDGSLDTSFSSDGKDITDFGGDDGGLSLIVQSDGKILVGGFTATNGDGDFALVRYNPDGNLDTSFSTDGKVITDIGDDDYGFGMVVQGDGKILVAGSTWLGNESCNFVLVRYNSDGSLDSSFSGGGIITTDINYRDQGIGIALQNDGKIIVVGESDGDFAVVRYNTNGSLDKTFSGDGIVTTNIGNYDSASSVTVQADGKILVAGFANGGTDQLFNIQPDGTILFGDQSCDFALVRYNTDGTLDTGFGSGGKVITDFDGNDTAFGIVLQSDGKIVLSGRGGNSGDFALARYNSNGTLDASFIGGSTGIDTTAPTVTAFSPADGMTGVAVGCDIVLTFSEAIQKGTGTIAIHRGSSTGTVVESYDAATSSSITISGNTLTINPSADLPGGKHYYVTFDDGSIKDMAGNNFAGTSAYDFITANMSTIALTPTKNPLNTFYISASQGGTLYDTNSDGVIDHVRVWGLGTSTGYYKMEWSDATHWTAKGVVTYAFGGQYDSQGRPTTCMVNGTELPIIWASAGNSEHLLATISRVTGTLSETWNVFDNNSDNQPDSGIYTATTNGVATTTISTSVVALTQDSYGRPTSFVSEIQTSSNPKDVFSGTVTGSSSHATAIQLPLGSSGAYTLMAAGTLVDSFTIYPSFIGRLYDMDGNSVIDQMDLVSTTTDQNGQSTTNIYSFALTWSDRTHWTAHAEVQMVFGTTVDVNGRPTTYVGVPDGLVHDIVWQNKGADNILATSSYAGQNSGELVVVTFIDSQGDSNPDEVVYVKSNGSTVIERFQANIVGWTNNSVAVTVVIQTATNPTWVFTGSVTGSNIHAQDILEPLFPENSGGGSALSSHTLISTKHQVDVFNISATDIGRLYDMDSNGIIDRMDVASTSTGQNGQTNTSIKSYALSWSDTAHWTAHAAYELLFGLQYDGQGRPTTIFMNGGEQTINWASSVSNGVLATVPSAYDGIAATLTLLDTNADSKPDTFDYTEESGSTLYTAHGTIEWWVTDSSNHPVAVTAVMQTSSNPADSFSGSVTGSNSNPTAIILPLLNNGAIDTIAPTVTNFSPVDGATGVSVGSNIVLTFSEAIQKGTGAIEIRSGTSDGALIAHYELATSPNLTIAGNTLTINPTADLASGTHYFVTFGNGNFTDFSGNPSTGTNTYDFMTDALPFHHNLTGSAAFWKTGAPITGVTSTLTTTAPAVVGAHPFEFRNIQLSVDGTRTLELWETSASSVESVHLEFTLSSGSVATWQDAAGLSPGWISLANTGISGQFILGSIGTTPLSAGPLKLGTLTLTAPTNSQHFELLLTAGQLNSDTISTFGIASDSMTTGIDGLYQHFDMPDGTYALISNKVSGTAEANAVHANDALAALKMAVGMNPNTDGSAVSPWQFLAADVNKDGVIRAADALNILKMAVKLETAPANEWLFVPESVGSESMSRTHVIWTDNPVPVTLDVDQELHLIGIVKGDVDGSWVG
jgi:uncharacterized delta-60 repeat protein